MTEDALIDLLLKRVHGSRGREGVKTIIRGTREHDARQREKVDEAFAISRGSEDVVAERLRQMTDEGFSNSMDDDYRDRSLVRAACCYALYAADTDDFRALGRIPLQWPWSKKWWKPTNRRRDLVKAAALIIAEIDRIDRGEIETR